MWWWCVAVRFEVVARGTSASVSRLLVVMRGGVPYSSQFPDVANVNELRAPPSQLSNTSCTCDCVFVKRSNERGSVILQWDGSITLTLDSYVSIGGMK